MTLSHDDCTRNIVLVIIIIVIVIIIIHVAMIGLSHPLARPLNGRQSNYIIPEL